MKILKRIAQFFLFLLALIIVSLPFFIRPLDDTPYQKMPFYNEMMQRLNGFPPPSMDEMPDNDLLVGWAKVNMTPAFAVPTAGYGKRAGKAINVVHDSLFARAFFLKQGASVAYIVSCDLLIIPPEVRLRVQQDLTAIGVDWQQIFIGATHTHNSMGAWGKRYIGELFAGKYDQNVVNLISTSIIEAVKNAQQNAKISTLNFQKTDAHELVFNRLVKEKGTIDPFVRLVSFTQKGGKRAALVTFSAHSTTLSDSVMQLSRDYSGLLVDNLEQKEGYDEAVFMAGCVGSMGPNEPTNMTDWQQAKFMADGIENKIDSNSVTDKTLMYKQLQMETLPLSMREPQWRFAENWCFRHWLWSNLYGDYASEIKVLRVGNVLMVGLPCDFSGELMKPLEEYAAAKGTRLIITSFNGGYVGYITKDEHYNLNKYETRMMNWFGPGNGAYLSEVVLKIIDRM